MSETKKDNFIDQAMSSDWGESHDSAQHTVQVGDLFDQIQQLACQVQSVDSYYQKAFQLIAKHYHCPYAYLSIQLPSMVIEDYHHQGATSPNFWKSSTQNAINDAIAQNKSHASFYRAKDDTSHITQHTLTLQDSKSQTIGAMSLMIYTHDISQAKDNQYKLKSLAGLISLSTTILLSRIQAQQEERKQTLTPNKALVNAAKSQSEHQLAFTITNNLRNKTQCEQVAIALVHGKRLDLLSISGFDQAPKRNPGVLKIKDAMCECLDRQDIIVYQTESTDWDEDKISGHYFLHKNWHEAAGAAAVASIPLITEGTCYAILSLRRKPSQPFTQKELETIQSAVQPFGPALHLVSHAKRNLYRHTTHSVKKWTRTLTAPGHIARKISLACFLLFSLWFCFGSIPYNVTVNSTLVPQRVTHVVSPFDGFIAKSYFTQGQTFRAGDIIYQLNTESLENEKALLQSQLAILQIEKKQAFHEKSPTKSRMAAAQIAANLAELTIIESKIRNAAYVAPFDGTVISGDLDKKIGQLIPQGQPLFELAPRHHWELELDIPDDAVSNIQLHLPTHFMAHAKPDIAGAGQITHLSRKLVAKGSRSVFQGRATLTNQAPWMRAGMQGVTQIHAGKKPVWWVTLHRAIDYFRIKFWL